MGYPYYVWLCADTCRSAANRYLPFLTDKACNSIVFPSHPFHRRNYSNRCNGNFHRAYFHYVMNKMKAENLMFGHLGNVSSFFHYRIVSKSESELFISFPKVI